MVVELQQENDRLVTLTEMAESQCRSMHEDRRKIVDVVQDELQVIQQALNNADSNSARDIMDAILRTQREVTM